MSTKHTILVALALLLAALPQRFVNLGSLSFYADEETTALPARSLTAGNGPRMPSGMEYRRALPLTWLNAASAALVGPGLDVSYRIPTAVFGALTVPLLFLVGRAFVAAPASAVAAVLLVGSEWHLVFSRQARMYASFLFFFVVAAWAIWKWTRSGRTVDLITALLAFAVTISLHILGVTVLLFALLPIVLPGTSRIPIWKLLGFVTASFAAAAAYDWGYVTAPYDAWDGAVAPPLRTPPEPAALGGWLGALPTWAIVLGTLGVAAGLWLGIRFQPNERVKGDQWRRGTIYVLAALTGAFACGGQLYAAAITLLVLALLHPDPWSRRRSVRAPLGVMFGVAALVAAVTITQTGVRGAIPQLAGFPFPYPAFFLDQFPVITVLFLIGAVWVALDRGRFPAVGPRVCALAVVLPLGALGVISEWGGSRYLLTAYPFLLLTASLALFHIVSWTASRITTPPRGAVTAVTVAAAASGVLGGHGVTHAIGIVTLNHGESVNEIVHMYPFRPDHKTVAEYVRSQRAPSDVVIAEDQLQFAWYGGDVEYWLRSYPDARAFLRDMQGRLNDIYAGSELLETRAEIDTVVRESAGRVWLVTSGETAQKREYYLSDDQRSLVDSLEANHAPAFVGRDAVSRVYCLNCGKSASDEP